MRKCKVFFTMALLAFLIGMSVLSCQSNDDDNYNSPKEQNLTAVDLFIASEAYQNLEKEIRKNMRRKRNAISRLSREEKERYHQLKIEWLNPKTRAEANVQLNLLLGYDEEADYDRISSLARKVYGGTKFTQLELMKALQKRQMKRAVVNTRTTDTEDLETCKKGCTDHATQSSGICFDNYNRDISELESMAEYYDPEYIRSEKEKLGTERKNCLDDADKEREECIKGCKGTDEKNR